MHKDVLGTLAIIALLVPQISLLQCANSCRLCLQIKNTAFKMGFTLVLYAAKRKEACQASNVVPLM